MFQFDAGDAAGFRADDIRRIEAASKADLEHDAVDTALREQQKGRAFEKAGFRPFRDFTEFGERMRYVTKVL